jgi:peroxiredoxin
MTENAVLLGSYVALWVIVAFQALLLMGLTSVVLRGTSGVAAEKMPQQPGLALGSDAPTFAARDLAGDAVSNTTLRGRLSALLFVQPRCQTCMTTLRELDMLSDKALGRITVICGGDPADCARIRERYGLTLPFVPDADRTVFDAFGVKDTPFAVLLDEFGRIESTGRPSRPADLAHDSDGLGADPAAEAHAQ